MLQVIVNVSETKSFAKMNVPLRGIRHFDKDHRKFDGSIGFKFFFGWNI